MPLVVEVAAGLIRDERGRYLITQRRQGSHLAGKWEFPGGKVEAGETDAAAVVRECREELGVEVVVGRRIGADARIDDLLTLRVYLARQGTLACRHPGPSAGPLRIRSFSAPNFSAARRELSRAPGSPRRR